MPDQIADKTISAAQLGTFRVLVISGPDRTTFLQGQLTQDIDAFISSGTALAGWCSAKGRLLAAGQLIAVEDEIWWPLPVDIIDNVAKRLQMFTLRADVKIVVSAMPVCGLLGVAGLDDVQIAGQTVRLNNQPKRLADDSLIVRVAGDPDRAWLIGSAADAQGFAATSEAAWVRQSICAGQPFIVADTQEMFVPQMVNMDRIGAIHFDKGCYVGQEIVARTQNLGRIKRRMYRFNADEPTGLRPAAHIFGPDNASGKIVLSSETSMPGELLAVIPIDQAAKPWFADETRNIQLTLQPLPYQINDQAHK